MQKANIIPIDWYGCPKKCLKKTESQIFEINLFVFKTEVFLVFTFLKGFLSGLGQFFAIESPSKMMKSSFYLT